MNPALLLRAVDYDHPDAVRLIAQVQAVYQERYGGVDATPLDPAEFAVPQGFFVVGYLDGCARGATAVACGGWRARDAVDGDPELRAGDAEIKRMFVVAGYRGRGFARAVLAELERTAVAAGRRRAVLETGVRQPEAIALYSSAGYAAIAKFGTYRQESGSRCFAKVLSPLARSDAPIGDARADRWSGSGDADGEEVARSRLRVNDPRRLP